MTDRQFYFNVGLHVFALVAAFAVYFAIHAAQPILERAAYLEGRHGLDRSTALRYALAEVR